jgi:hypothetical protein
MCTRVWFLVSMLKVMTLCFASFYWSAPQVRPPLVKVFVLFSSEVVYNAARRLLRLIGFYGDLQCLFLFLIPFSAVLVVIDACLDLFRSDVTSRQPIVMVLSELMLGAAGYLLEPRRLLQDKQHKHEEDQAFSMQSAELDEKEEAEDLVSAPAVPTDCIAIAEINNRLDSESLPAMAADIMGEFAQVCLKYNRTFTQQESLWKIVDDVPREQSSSLSLSIIRPGLSLL